MPSRSPTSSSTNAPANNNLKAVKITTLPAANKGTLLLNGTPITPAQVAAGFRQAIDMAIGNFQFLSTANQNGVPLATFQFQVQDDGGTAVSMASRASIWTPAPTS